MDHALSLLTMRQALDDLRNKRMAIADFCTTWRAQQSLLNTLPARYGQVMEDLLGRMEAGALFGEESCSFSPQDLQTNLSVWLDKATQALTPA